MGTGTSPFFLLQHCDEDAPTRHDAIYIIYYLSPPHSAYDTTSLYLLETV